MSEIESTIFDICNPDMNDFHDEDFLEPAEIFFLDKILEENENEFLDLIRFYINEKADSSIFLLEVLGNLNYLPVINVLSDVLGNLSNELNIYEKKDGKWYENAISNGINFTECLIKLNSSSGLGFIKKNFNELGEWYKRNFIEFLFNVNSKLALELIGVLVGYKVITNDVYLDKINNYLKEIKIKEELNSLIKFSIEIQFEHYNIKSKDELLNSLKKLLEKNQIEVVFRSLEDDIGGFIDRRTRINFDLFTNQNISAKEIVKLFRNDSALYFSGNTHIGEKKVFYENVAWYRENKNMSEENKIFWNNPSIVKFRIYNVVYGL